MRGLCRTVPHERGQEVRKLKKHQCFRGVWSKNVGFPKICSGDVFRCCALLVHRRVEKKKFSRFTKKAWVRLAAAPTSSLRSVARWTKVYFIVTLHTAEVTWCRVASSSRSNCYTVTFWLEKEIPCIGTRECGNAVNFCSYCFELCRIVNLSNNCNFAPILIAFYDYGWSVIWGNGVRTGRYAGGATGLPTTQHAFCEVQ